MQISVAGPQGRGSQTSHKGWERKKPKDIFFLTRFIHHKCQCTSVRTSVTERV